MNCFDKVIQLIGTTNDNQGDAGALHMLLSYASLTYSGSDTFADPRQETLRRVYAALGEKTHAFKALEKALGLEYKP